jgi:hypothetical protein
MFHVKHFRLFHKKLVFLRTCQIWHKVFHVKHFVPDFSPPLNYCVAQYCFTKLVKHFYSDKRPRNQKRNLNSLSHRKPDAIGKHF